MNYKYVYGTVPSRRMGLSIGISPIPKKYCNFSCVYCQLGRTDHLSNKREEFFPLNEIVHEFKLYMNEDKKFDVVTIVGEGEPTLYLRLGDLIEEIKKLTDKPLAVITNGGLMYDKQLREELKKADLVLPTLDAHNEELFRKINRPHGSIKFKDMIEGLRLFSKEYNGQLWIETMIVKDFNDSKSDFLEFKKILDTLNYDRIYVNAPVRPPAEGFVEQPTKETIGEAVEILNGISIDELVSEGFYSEVKDDYEAILSIIRRHPMNQFEIMAFVESRGNNNPEGIIKKLNDDQKIDVVNYKNYYTYRLK